MKVIAYYLPQFHQIPENDRWWGKGFTEWTNVKKAKPLFRNHYQPRIPLEGYYSLDDRKTLAHQADLMKKYHISGMAFYHYWFEGKMLLEKPVYNLLKWTDIQMPFMFFWANHSWIRSWNGTSELLMKQSYGRKKDWKQHFMYFLPYFMDPRYIRMNGKPAVGVYNAADIPDFDSMIECWEGFAKENGLKGIYIIETMMGDRPDAVGKRTDALTLRAPNIATRDMFSNKLFYKIIKYPVLQKMIPAFYPYRYSYEAVKRRLLNISKNFQSDKDIIFGDFVDWDNTCRHGKRGSVAVGQSPEQFRYYFSELCKIGKERNVEYIFMNAWNEWAEGMYLEPDQKNRFAYLEAICEVIAD